VQCAMAKPTPVEKVGRRESANFDGRKKGLHTSFIGKSRKEEGDVIHLRKVLWEEKGNQKEGAEITFHLESHAGWGKMGQEPCLFCLGKGRRERGGGKLPFLSPSLGELE